MRSTFSSSSRPGTLVQKGNGKSDYNGPERRWQGERRIAADRRQAFRWEPGKEDRRSGKDRRENGGLADPWKSNGRIF